MTIHVTRAEWGARSPVSVSRNITPTSVTGHWEGTGKSSAAIDHTGCDELVRQIQNFHMNTRGWADIAYSGMACWHDYFFEGRGPGVRTAANGTNTGNQNSYAICALIVKGDVANDGVKSAMTHGAAWLGFPLNKVHSQWKSTACPGPELTAWIYGGTTAPPTPPTPPTPPPSGVPTFPLPTGHFFGPKSGPSYSHSGYYNNDDDKFRPWQAQMSARGWTISVDGLYGPQTADVCKKFQLEKDLKVDGLIGPQTWSMAWTSPVT